MSQSCPQHANPSFSFCSKEKKGMYQKDWQIDSSFLIWWVVVHGYKLVEWLIPIRNENKHYFFRLSLPLVQSLALPPGRKAWQQRYVNDSLYVNYFHVNKHYFFRLSLPFSRLVCSVSHSLVTCQGEERYVNVNLYVNYFHVDKRYFFRLRPQPVVCSQPYWIPLTWRPRRLL